MSKFFKTCDSVYSSSFSAYAANCVSRMGRGGFSMLYRELEDRFCIDPYAETLLLVNGKPHSLPHKYIKLIGFEEIKISYLDDGFQMAFLKNQDGLYAFNSPIETNGASLFVSSHTNLTLGFSYDKGWFKIRANESHVVFTILSPLDDLSSLNFAVLQQTFSVPIRTFTAKYYGIPYKDAFLHNLAQYWSNSDV